MIKIKTFKRGGIHPDDKKLTKEVPIEEFPIPDKVYIPLTQNLGAPPEPIVKKGDFVKTGQLIAEAKSFVSANVHSSVTGIVEKIDEHIDVSGYRKLTIIINAEKTDNWVEDIDTSNNIVREIKIKNKSEIINKIREKGIVGMGGATFPTHVKLSIPEGKKCDYLIINGVECEPYLTSDHRLMLEKGEEILIGAKILMLALDVNTCYIGIENNKPDAINHLLELSKNYEGIIIQPLKLKYPQGAEKQLIYAITGREVPSGGLPIDVGCIVQNVGTTYAVYEAVQKNKPLIYRIVTVSGEGFIGKNFLVRIGTPIKLLINSVIGDQNYNFTSIISGGPMMGKALISTEVPVTKGTSGILLFKDYKEQKLYPCIKCAKCVMVCPMGLMPSLLEKLIANERIEEAHKNNVLDCIECGCCEYTCPSFRPLLEYIRLGKNKVLQMLKSKKN